MDTSNEAIAAALATLNQKIAEMELSIDVKEPFLVEYKKNISDIAILKSYLSAKNGSGDLELTLQNLATSISESQNRGE